MESDSADLTQTESHTQRSTISLKTRSETDILDDGYRWKKYGQKEIKNSQYQRLYFRCTVKGCVVKKKCQRCDDDPLFVLTTYQGTHNHPSDNIRSSALRNSYDLKNQLPQAVDCAKDPANTLE